MWVLILMYEKICMNISELWSEGDRDCINCGEILLVKGKPVQAILFQLRNGYKYL